MQQRRMLDNLEELREIFREYTNPSDVVGIGSGRTMKMFCNVISDENTYISTSLQTDMDLKGKNCQ